jgi:hypothetical protein
MQKFCQLYQKNGPILSDTALEEYEDDSETEEDGKDLD